MFCSQCGKKIIETMLFCPFCGAPIVIPDQDEVPASEPAAAKPAPAPIIESAAVSPAAATIVEPTEEFRPLNLEKEWDSYGETPAKAAVPEQTEQEEKVEKTPSEPRKGDVADEISELLSSGLREDPVKLQGHVPDLTNVREPRKGDSKRRNTYAPVREFNPDDIFLSGGDDDDDDYDDRDDRFDYEEPETGGFLLRHIRGVVALTLLLVASAIVLGWSLSDGGQMSLAKINLAWRASAYERLGYQAHESGNYVLSGSYYEKALSRDEDSFNYAYSAGVAYYKAQDNVRSAEMAKKAIELDPQRTEGYELLLRLYPDAKLRPWEVTSLLQQGYRLTGDASFNVES